MGIDDDWNELAMGWREGWVKRGNLGNSSSFCFYPKGPGKKKKKTKWRRIGGKKRKKKGIVMTKASLMMEARWKSGTFSFSLLPVLVRNSCSLFFFFWSVHTQHNQPMLATYSPIDTICVASTNVHAQIAFLITCTQNGILIFLTLVVLFNFSFYEKSIDR